MKNGLEAELDDEWATASTTTKIRTHPTAAMATAVRPCDQLR